MTRASGASSREERGPSEIRVGRTLQFMQLLLELAHALQTLSKRMDVVIGVTAAQRLAIRLVGRAPGVTAGEVAAAMRIHPSTFTGILRRLLESGALARTADADDARRARLTLTAHGRALNDDQRPTVEAAVRRALLRASATEVEHARKLLTYLVEELERETEGAE